MPRSTSPARSDHGAGEDTTPYPGAPLARGPMGGDQYTKIHNYVFRDPRLSAKAKGIFGFLSTHVEGWRTDAKSIARDMKDGRDSIQTGLQELERHHYLIRHRVRHPDGRLGETVWFYTDLPAQIRALGITDDAVVLDRVRTEFERWQADQRIPRSAPEPENPEQAPTSENADASPGVPPDGHQPVDNLVDPARSSRSAPETGFPATANPATANPPHKKNNNQKTKYEKTNQGGPAPLEPPNPAAAAAGTNNNRNRSSRKDSKHKTRSNPLTAHARKQRACELAGPAAVAAIAADPLISIDDLANVIARSNPRLTQAQATSRATALAAWTRQSTDRASA